MALMGAREDRISAAGANLGGRARMKKYWVRGAGGGLVSIVLVLSGCSRNPPPAPTVPLPALEASAAAPVGDTQYRLQPGDTLRVKFLYHPEMDVKLPVRPDGKITLQAAGELDAKGMTTDQLAEEIRQKSSDRLRDPEVTVIVAEVGDQGIYVGGEVRNPGVVKYRRGMTPLEAILNRGGFTDFARIDYVVHLMAQHEEYVATRVDLSHSLQGEGENVHLAANDMLYVPRNSIGDVTTFIRLYVHSFLPIPPRVGVGFNPLQ